MEIEKLNAVIDNMASLMDKHREASRLMEKMIHAMVREYLKQNDVRQTLNESEATHAAVKYMMGFSKVYQTPHQLYLSKRCWPTHLRKADLAPVRLTTTLTPGGEDQVIVRHPRGGVLEKTTQSGVEERYIDMSAWRGTRDA